MLRVRAAGFTRRLVAAIIDALLVNVVAMGATLVAALALGVSLPGFKELGPDFVLAGLLDRNPMALGALGLLAGMSALYEIYLGGILGQTAGKHLLRLRVSRRAAARLDPCWIAAFRGVAIEPTSRRAGLAVVLVRR